MAWKYAYGMVDEVTLGTETVVSAVDDAGNLASYKDMQLRAMSGDFPNNKEAVFVVNPRVTRLPSGWIFTSTDGFVEKFTELAGRAPTDKEM